MQAASEDEVKSVDEEARIQAVCKALLKEATHGIDNIEAKCKAAMKGAKQDIEKLANSTGTAMPQLDTERESSGAFAAAAPCAAPDPPGSSSNSTHKNKEATQTTDDSQAEYKATIKEVKQMISFHADINGVNSGTPAPAPPPHSAPDPPHSPDEIEGRVDPPALSLPMRDDSAQSQYGSKMQLEQNSAKLSQMEKEMSSLQSKTNSLQRQNSELELRLIGKVDNLKESMLKGNSKLGKRLHNIVHDKIRGHYVGIQAQFDDTKA